MACLKMQNIGLAPQIAVNGLPGLTSALDFHGFTCDTLKLFFYQGKTKLGPHIFNCFFHAELKEMKICLEVA